MITAAVVGALALAGCSGAKPVATPSPSATPTAAPKPAFSIANVPADLAQQVEALYTGAAVSADPAVTQALGARQAVPVPADVKGAVGNWEGTDIGSIQAGNDVSLYARRGSAWTLIGGWWPGLGVATPVLGKERLMLFIGADARPGEDPAGSHADALQLVSYDGADAGSILGIARDTWVQMPSGGMAKINAAMTQGGPTAQLEVIKKVSGLPVNGYMLIDFNGFRNLVQNVGGLQINVPQAMVAQGSEIKAGPQTLDGTIALRFARERKTLADGDFGRSLNQGKVLMAGAAMAQGIGPGQLASYVHFAGRYVASDLNAEQVLLWFANVYRVNLNKVTQDVCKGNLGEVAGQSVVYMTAREERLYRDMRDLLINGK